MAFMMPSGEDLLSTLRARDMVEYIKERVTGKEDTLRTRILPYDLQLAVRVAEKCRKNK